MCLFEKEIQSKEYIALKIKRKSEKVGQQVKCKK